MGVPRNRHGTASKRLIDAIKVAQGIANVANEAHRTRTTSCSLYEAAFLRAYTAWERFLESVFFDYLLGHAPLGKKGPSRYYTPPSRQAAKLVLCPQQKFLDWTDPVRVIDRCRGVFRSRDPVSSALGSYAATLMEMKKIRNAIAHDSSVARESFSKLVRSKVRTLPPRCTPGSFLSMRIPYAHSPRSFFEDYAENLKMIARLIAT